MFRREDWDILSETAREDFHFVWSQEKQKILYFIFLTFMQFSVIKMILENSGWEGWPNAYFIIAALMVIDKMCVGGYFVTATLTEKMRKDMFQSNKDLTDVIALAHKEFVEGHEDHGPRKDGVQDGK